MQPIPAPKEPDVSPTTGSAGPPPTGDLRRRDVRRRRQVGRRTALLTAAAAALLAGGAVLAVGGHANNELHAAAVPARAADGVIVSGSPVAPMTVDVTAAYGCTGCAAAFADLAGPLEQARAEGVARVRYRVTVSRDPKVEDGQTQVNPDTAHVANALACASDISTEVAAGLWNNVIPFPLDSVTGNALIEAAARAGITAPAFHTCVTTGTYLDWVTLRANTGTVTPTFRLNGAATTAAALTTALNDALAARATPADSGR